MLVENLPGGTFERARSAEPFIGDNPQGILITGKAGLSTNLLRSHIRDGASHLLGGEQLIRW